MVIKVLTNIALGVIIVFWFCIAYILLTHSGSRTQVIDCTWAEISPDFSPQAREACRKLRMEQVK